MDTLSWGTTRFGLVLGGVYASTIGQGGRACGDVLYVRVDSVGGGLL
jgi:hypothetical protein